MSVRLLKWSQNNDIFLEILTFLDIWTKNDFSSKYRIFWHTKTTFPWIFIFLSRTNFKNWSKKTDFFWKFFLCQKRFLKVITKKRNFFNVINTRRSRSEDWLETIYVGIEMVFYPIQYDLGDYRQLLQIFRLHFFRIFTMIPSVHFSGNASPNQVSSNMGCSTSAAM